ncbi:MAG TPA: DUF2145 domain-containing protein [Burkholderiaceae bacterium]
MRFGVSLALAANIAAGAAVLVGAAGAANEAHAQSSTNGNAASIAFCDRTQKISADQQDHILRFAAVVRDALNASGSDTVLISRSGLDLARFHIRYSHAAILSRNDAGTWTARQLYYACDEGNPRIYDQGLAGFAAGSDDPALGYISIIRLPADAAQALRKAALDGPRALSLLARTYSANAYPFSTRYQNCNQWVIEMLAVAWGGLHDGDDLRASAQHWLAQSGYTPEPVEVGSHLLMMGAFAIPLLHLDDHPEADRYALRIKTSLPSTIEAFIRQRFAASERIEICHNSGQIVVHRGWTPVAEGCRPSAGDRVTLFD